MTIADLLGLEIPAIPGAVGFTGLGAILIHFWRHQRLARKDSDNVAIALIPELMKRIEALEAAAEVRERAHEAETRALRHELTNVEMSFESLLLAIELAPDRAAEAVTRVKELRANKLGEKRQAAQTMASTARVVSDALAGRK